MKIAIMATGGVGGYFGARRFIKLIGAWRRRARGRRELMAKTDRELRDLGITRQDASREATKPFWRE
jgi:uncharacterized protein YjiS (DUF1127 family)